jgi:hypothetical protein
VNREAGVELLEHRADQKSTAMGVIAQKPNRRGDVPESKRLTAEKAADWF